MGMLKRRQLSATEKMAAIFGPASLLPRCNQFFLPIAIGLLVWLGLYLREPRLKALIPLRTPS